MLKPGDEVMHLPSGLTTTIERIDTARGPVAEAFPPMSVTLLLDDDLDISRGDMFCRPHNQPPVAQDVEAMVCWMTDARTLSPRSRLIVKHTTRTVKAHRPGPALPARREHPAPGRECGRTRLNEIGRVTLRLTQPVFCDPYTRNRLTGGLILIDEATNATVGAAVITDAR